MQNIIFAQGLLIDESKQSYSWLFNQIIEAMGIYPSVINLIITDSDLAVNATVKEATFKNHFAKIIENYLQLRGYLEGLYSSKHYWAHSYISFRFTGGMIASSRDESVNACIKRMLFNLDVSLCELMTDIHKLLDEVVYYVANVIDCDDIGAINDKEFYEDECVDSLQVTINQLLEVSDQNDQIPEHNISYLCAVDKEKEDHLEQRINILNEKIMYRTLYVLKDFANENSECEFEGESYKESKDSGGSDKENEF
ncbi:hypothetical protein C1645_825506 [Glomus cerebriforme]|uniref:MULE transposase domain-containing protein n=1 Tax=Glomus cerebriforme TaxID=658196 RepID=A0A397T1F5_9GLOM|nr:hypothetical protein C1645_825506 [Glomus cerebriforme]